MKFFTAMLLVCFVSVFTLSTKAGSVLPAHSHVMSGHQMHGDASASTMDNTVHHPSSAQDCCKQECHCDTSLCHASVLMLTPFNDLQIVAVSDNVAKSIPAPLTAHGGPLYKPPIILS